MKNQRFRDLFAEFNVAGVEYLLVGAHALAVHGHVRATKDIDVWVQPTPQNARRVLTALQTFGAWLDDLSADDLSRADTIVQLGVPPLRIDIITGIDGVDFESAWRARVVTSFLDQPVNVLSREHLLQNKRASGRTQDLADVEALEALEQ